MFVTLSSWLVLNKYQSMSRQVNEGNSAPVSLEFLFAQIGAQPGARGVNVGRLVIITIVIAVVVVVSIIIIIIFFLLRCRK